MHTALLAAPRRARRLRMTPHELVLCTPGQFVTLIIYKPDYRATLESWQQQQQRHVASQLQQQQLQKQQLQQQQLQQQQLQQQQMQQQQLQMQQQVQIQQQVQQHSLTAAQQQALQQQQILYMQQQLQQQQQQIHAAGAMASPAQNALWGAPSAPVVSDGQAVAHDQRSVSWSDTLMHGVSTEHMMPPPPPHPQLQGCAPSQSMAPGQAAMGSGSIAADPHAPPPLFKLPPTPGSLQPPPPMMGGLGGGMLSNSLGGADPAASAFAAGVGAEPSGTEPMEMASRHNSNAALMDTSGLAASSWRGPGEAQPYPAARQDSRNDVVMR